MIPFVAITGIGAAIAAALIASGIFGTQWLKGRQAEAARPHEKELREQMMALQKAIGEQKVSMAEEARAEAKSRLGRQRRERKEAIAEQERGQTYSQDVDRAAMLLGAGTGGGSARAAMSAGGADALTKLNQLSNPAATALGPSITPQEAQEIIQSAYPVSDNPVTNMRRFGLSSGGGR